MEIKYVSLLYIEIILLYFLIQPCPNNNTSTCDTADPELVKSKIIERGHILLRTDSSTSMQSASSTMSSKSKSSNARKIFGKTINHSSASTSGLSSMSSSSEPNGSGDGSVVNTPFIQHSSVEGDHGFLETKFNGRVDVLEQQHSLLLNRPSSSSNIVTGNEIVGSNDCLSDIEAKFVKTTLYNVTATDQVSSYFEGDNDGVGALDQQQEQGDDSHNPSSRYSRNNGRFNKQHSWRNYHYLNNDNNMGNPQRNQNGQSIRKYRMNNINNTENNYSGQLSTSATNTINNDVDGINNNSSSVVVVGKRDFKGTGKLFYDTAYNKDILNIDCNTGLSNNPHHHYKKNDYINNGGGSAGVRLRKNNAPSAKQQKYKKQQQHQQQQERPNGPYVRKDGVLMLMKQAKPTTASTDIHSAVSSSVLKKGRNVPVYTSSRNDPTTTPVLSTTTSFSAIDQLKSAFFASEINNFHQHGGLTGASTTGVAYHHPSGHPHLAPAMEPRFALSSPIYFSRKSSSSVVDDCHYQQHDVLAKTTTTPPPTPSCHSYSSMSRTDTSTNGLDNEKNMRVVGSKMSMSMLNIESPCTHHHHASYAQDVVLLGSSNPKSTVGAAGGMTGAGGSAAAAALTHRNRGFLLLDP